MLSKRSKLTFISLQGDDGGPLVCNGVLAGVYSFGNFCGSPQYPRVFTDVRKYHKLITGVEVISGGEFVLGFNLISIGVVSLLLIKIL